MINGWIVASACIACYYIFPIEIVKTKKRNWLGYRTFSEEGELVKKEWFSVFWYFQQYTHKYDDSTAYLVPWA